MDQVVQTPFQSFKEFCQSKARAKRQDTPKRVYQDLTQNGDSSIINVVFTDFRTYSNQTTETTFEIRKKIYQDWKEKRFGPHFKLSQKHFKQVYKPLYENHKLHSLAARGFIKEKHILKWSKIEKKLPNDLNKIQSEEDITKLLEEVLKEEKEKEKRKQKDVEVGDDKNVNFTDILNFFLQTNGVEQNNPENDGGIDEVDNGGNDDEENTELTKLIDIFLRNIEVPQNDNQNNEGTDEVDNGNVVVVESNTGLANIFSRNIEVPQNDNQNNTGTSTSSDETSTIRKRIWKWRILVKNKQTSDKNPSISSEIQQQLPNSFKRKRKFENRDNTLEVFVLCFVLFLFYLTQFYLSWIKHYDKLVRETKKHRNENFSLSSRKPSRLADINLSSAKGGKLTDIQNGYGRFQNDLNPDPNENETMVLKIRIEQTIEDQTQTLKDELDQQLQTLKDETTIEDIDHYDHQNFQTLKDETTKEHLTQTLFIQQLTLGLTLILIFLWGFRKNLIKKIHIRFEKTIL